MAWGEDIQAFIEQALQQVRAEMGDALADAITPIVHLNNQRCRLRQRHELQPAETVQEYVFQVANNYKKDHSYLHLIQNQKCDEAWEALLDKIRAWSYSFLSTWYLDHSTRRTFTIEIAQEAAPEILYAHFPYDCEFDPWACKITHHACSKFMQRHGNSPVMDTVDLSDVDEWFREPGDLSSPDLETKFASRQLLLDAVDQLSDKQKFVIWHFYFEGWPLPDIAAHLKVKTNAVYKRHFDALDKLRKILEANEHKDE